MIQRQDHDGIAVLQMAHGKANAIDLELFTALDEALVGVAEEDGVHAVVITGTGKIFSAGVDLFRVLDAGPEYLDAFLPALSSVITRIPRMSLPVVAAVNGHAIAGGCILACACDRRIMSDHERARIGVSELVVGVPFPVAALEVLRALLPEQKVHEMVYGGKALSPQDALAVGLVDEITTPGDVLEEAIGAARRLAQIPSRAFALTKQQLRDPLLQRVERLAPQLDPQVVEAWKDPATQDRIRAFMEKMSK